MSVLLQMFYSQQQKMDDFDLTVQIKWRQRASKTVEALKYILMHVTLLLIFHSQLDSDVIISLRITMSCQEQCNMTLFSVVCCCSVHL